MALKVEVAPSLEPDVNELNRSICNTKIKRYVKMALAGTKYFL